MARKKFKRDEELSGRGGEFDDDLLDLMKTVEKGYQDQSQRSNEIQDNWDMYNCVLGENQFYNGESKIYLPFVHDAVEARVTRFVNQLFPQSGRNVEVTSTEEDLPQATTALLEAYVRKAKLRTEVVPALLRNGDCEGQYSLYVDWNEFSRQVVTKTKTKPQTGGLDNEAAEEVDDVTTEEIFDACPMVEVISDLDLCVLPATADSIEESLQFDGSVTVLRRWTKGKIKAMARDGHITQSAADDLLEALSQAEAATTKNELTDIQSENAKAAGIKGRGKFTLVYETWAIRKIGTGKDKARKLCRIFYGGDKRILGCKQNPFWNDRCPVISAPVIKIGGVFKGVAPVSFVRDLQIFANDTINEGADTAHFSAMPIVMTDPEKNPRVGTMILGLGAVWETNPNDTQFVEFPELWQNAMERAKAIQQQIFQTLGVNPSMIPNATGGKSKRNQAEMATEQQVDLLTTADAVTILEESIMTPLVQRFAEYDQQFREDAILIRSYGDMGLRVTMEEVEPLQLGSRYEFRWFGVESNRNAAQIQQQIAGLNILKSLPPESHPNHTINLSPIIVQLVENTYGPRLGSLIFQPKNRYTLDPEQENEMLQHGFRLAVHTDDDDMHHMEVHMKDMQEHGDPHGTHREHIALHQHQMMDKAKAQQMQMQGGPGGGPGGAPGGQPQQQSGGGGQPQPGAQPGQPVAAKGPPGMIHPDQMGRAGAVVPPRHT